MLSLSNWQLGTEFSLYLVLYYTTQSLVTLFYSIFAVETKNCLDERFSRDDALNNLVKPPANLLVLEGDCLDTSGDAGELDSYLVV